MNVRTALFDFAEGVTKRGSEKPAETDQQNETDAAATDGGSAEIKTAATEKEQQDDNQQQGIHPPTIAALRGGHYGAFAPTKGDRMNYELGRAGRLAEG